MVECGDIIQTPWGIMLVEAIKRDGTFIGHELKGKKSFWTRNHDKDIQILSSTFRKTGKSVNEAKGEQ